MRKVLLLLAVFSTFAMANDARINALGGSDMYRDVKDVYSNPAFATQYRVIEANINAFANYDDTGAYIDNEEYVGSALGTWKVGEKVTLGGYYADSSMTMASYFLADSTFTSGQTVHRVQSPHAFIGIAFSDKFHMGFDLYSEMNKYETVTTIGSNTTTLTQDTKVFGGAIGANLYLGKIDLEILAKGALPLHKDKNVTTDPSWDTVPSQADGISLLGDVKLGVNFTDDFMLRTGLGYAYDQVKYYSLTDGVENANHTYGDFTALVGVAKELEFDMTFAFEAATSIATEKHGGPSRNVTSSAFFLSSAEKSFGQTKLFDHHYFRMALGLGIAGSQVKGGDATSDTIARWGSDLDGDKTDLAFALGFGFDRGKFGFDMYIENVDLDFSDNAAGIWNLFPTAGATFTLDFAQKSSTLRKNKGKQDVSAYEAHDAAQDTPSFYSQPADESTEIIGDEN